MFKCTYESSKIILSSRLKMETLQPLTGWEIDLQWQRSLETSVSYFASRIYVIKITEKMLVCDAGETYCEVKEQTGADTYNVRFRFIWTEEMGEGFREMVSSHHITICALLNLGFSFP